MGHWFESISVLYNDFRMIVMILGVLNRKEIGLVRSLCYCPMEKMWRGVLSFFFNSFTEVVHHFITF